MRWLALIFSLNVALALWFWNDARQIKTGPTYQLADGVVALEVSALGSGCLLLGPIVDRQVAEDFERSIVQAGLNANLIRKDREKAPRYWVYYGPMETYSESLEQHRKFKSEGIDNFIITQEDLYGALSVGVFENIDSAQRLQAIMRAKGYKTAIRNIFKFESRWWVEVSVSESDLIINKINSLQGDHGLDLEMREFFCKTVASEKPLP